MGARVLEIADRSLGASMPSMSPQARADAAALIDLLGAQALSAARDMATSSAAASSWVIRALLGAVTVLAFAVVGVVLWSLEARIDKTETGIAAAITSVAATEVHREKLDDNVKLLAAHAVALTAAVNDGGQANYELLDVLVDKLDARADVPALHKPPARLEVPVMLRVAAGER